MSNHMVIYRGPDGKPGYHQTEDIHDAVGFVEQLRNDQGVEHARIFRLEELAFNYRPYFRVELSGGAPAVESGSSAPAVAAAPAEAEEASTEAADEAPAASSDDKPAATETAAPSVTEVAATATESASAAPTITSPSTGTDNGVGARRGLFGR